MRKRRKRSALYLLKKAADRAISIYIRNETNHEWGHCPLCPDQDNANPIQCCFHFCRAKWCPNTRWDVRNVVGSCNRCNWIEYRNPDPSRAWFLNNRGLYKYLLVVEDSKKKFVPTEEYLTDIIKTYSEPTYSEPEAK